MFHLSLIKIKVCIISLWGGWDLYWKLCRIRSEKDVIDLLLAPKGFYPLWLRGTITFFTDGVNVRTWCLQKEIKRTLEHHSRKFRSVTKDFPFFDFLTCSRSVTSILDQRGAVIYPISYQIPHPWPNSKKSWISSFYLLFQRRNLLIFTPFPIFFFMIFDFNMLGCNP